MKKSFGLAIKEARMAKGITQIRLSQLLGVAHGNVSRYESGKSVPDMDRLVLIAEILDTTITEIMAAAEGIKIDNRPGGYSVPLVPWAQLDDWTDQCQKLARCPKDIDTVNTTYRVTPKTFAVRVTGNSMEPAFPSGCVIIIEPGEPHPGEYVIVKRAHKLPSFRQLIEDEGVMYLKPLSNQYKMVELSPTDAVIGVAKRLEMDV